MTKLAVIFGDQLSLNTPALQKIDPDKDQVLMGEVLSEANYVKHHKKKLAFIFSAMRHFANNLIELGFNVTYVKLDDANNTGSISSELERFLSNHCDIDQILVTHPNEYRVLQYVKSWQTQLSVSVDILEDNSFLCTHSDFKLWASKQNNLRLETFYRFMRKKHNILMHKDKPVGGRWNFDKDNRENFSKEHRIPEPFYQEPDTITKEVITLVNEKFGSNFGDILPFSLAVTREQASLCLDDFIKNRLALFGKYQDAMVENNPWLYHSHIAFYLNIGLLSVDECLTKAINAYNLGQAPINSVEGFIRQIIGWREYIRGVYWLKMPEYKDSNFFNAKQLLPSFYWDAHTSMNCVKQCVLDTKKYAYAHHIQRLMVLGNFALLVGVHPDYLNDWFLSVYADAYEWVELPNVNGMALFADGGVLATKPYASGGSYINKMSNYCKGCKYKVKEKFGADACPFNYLYWDFLVRNRNLLNSNFRLVMMYSLYDKMSLTTKDAIKTQSEVFINSLGDK